MNALESIFRLSRVYDGYYDEEKLPQLKWDWPSGTWFQARRDHIRERHQPFAAKAGRIFPQSNELSET